MATADATDGDAAKTRCHYEVLGVERDADAVTIKKAHRKLALRLHPDKNVGDNSAQHLFLQVQQAYECLSDAAERKWYDEHREAILKGWTATTGKDQVDILFDVEPYMYAGCYKGYQDGDAKGFFSVYENVFQQVYQGELEGCNESSAVDYLGAVSFGSSTSEWDNVVAFYQAWESFSSILTYAWADQWNVQEAEQRRVRRAMDEDNRRSRRKARHSRNDEIAALVHFVKRRDPRVIARKELQEEEKAAREKELKEAATARKKEKEKAMEEWREQADRQFVAAEEEDRLRGRIRLADLEDDYDYGGGKKKGKKGRKKKGWSSDEEKEEKDGTKEDEEATASPDTEEAGEEIAAADIPEGEVETGENEATAVVDGIEAPVTANPSQQQQQVVEDEWSCECCKEVFTSKLQMLSHLKSKKHKEAAVARKLEKQQEDDHDSGFHKKKSKKKKNKQGWSSDEEHEVDTKRKSEAVQLASPDVSVEKPTTVAFEPTAAADFPSAQQVEDQDPVSEEDESEGEESEEEEEPVFWRCECCQKDFQSEGQMENHLNSKKHKVAFKKYEAVLGKKLLEEVIDELKISDGQG